MPSGSTHRLAHHGAFGNDRFGILAERFARFFGTPKFIIGQTLLRQSEVLARERALAEQHLVLLAQNTRLTEQIARLTTELHAAICRDSPPAVGMSRQ